MIVPSDRDFAKALVIIILCGWVAIEGILYVFSHLRWGP